jgi:arginyl-tRNA synthetase
MVATTGNTGPYLQYAHARVTQVLRKAAAEGLAEQNTISVLNESAEQALALLLSRFGEVVEDVADNLQPHKLCSYLYDLSVALATFYEQCPVLKSEGDIRNSRLALCVATKRVLARGLYLLGIEALERM